MRKRIYLLLVSFSLMLCLLPLHTFATAGYVASVNSDVFHKANCYYVGKIKESNKIWFDTVEEAETSGRRGCYRCNPTAGRSSSSTISTTSNNVANTDYARGYTAGKASGEKEGYESGYSDGQSDMKTEMEAEIEEASKDASFNAYLFSLVLGAPFVAYIVSSISEKSRIKSENRLKDEIAELKKELNIERNKNTLRSANPGLTMPADIPPDVTLNLSCTPVKGRKTPERPFGEYTVYTTPNGKKYHCKYRCCNATNPVHLFKIPDGLTPCMNCVPAEMRFNRLPNWYLQIANPNQMTVKTISPPPKSAITTESKVGTATENGSSTAISFIGYQNGILILTFQSGGTYRYDNVPEGVYKEMLAAPSKGKFYHERIKDRYLQA